MKTVSTRTNNKGEYYMKLFKTLALVALIAVQTAPTDLFATPKKDRTIKIKKEKKAKKMKLNRTKKISKCCPCPQAKTGPMRIKNIAQTPEPGL